MVDLELNLKFSFFHGPDCVPFDIGNARKTVFAAYEPFHGIISRGLLSRFIKEGVTPGFWYKKAPYLNGFFHNPTALDNELELLGTWARECEVLTFPQSASLAKMYMLNYFSRNPHSPKAECSLWNVKEGHTSSVWKITIVDNSQKQCFALNISRDRDAAGELMGTSKAMMEIELACPDIQMARVQDISTIPFDYFGKPIEVTAVRNEWVENAFEIHSGVDKHTGQSTLLLVERFIQKPDNPAQTVSILGRTFTNQEVNAINGSIKLFTKLASKALSRAVEININDGDVVWNGNKAIVVAID